MNDQHNTREQKGRFPETGQPGQENPDKLAGNSQKEQQEVIKRKDDQQGGFREKESAENSGSAEEETLGIP